MASFQNKLTSLILPATRDFEGLSEKSFDGRGNYSFGIKDYSVFPEIPFNNNAHKIGIDVTIVTSATNDEQARVLLEEVGYPFKKKPKIVKQDTNKVEE
jgi:large subunit ribosomal protein L5